LAAGTRREAASVCHCSPQARSFAWNQILQRRGSSGSKRATGRRIEGQSASIRDDGDAVRVPEAETRRCAMQAGTGRKTSRTACVAAAQPRRIRPHAPQGNPEQPCCVISRTIFAAFRCRREHRGRFAPSFAQPFAFCTPGLSQKSGSSVGMDL